MRKNSHYEKIAYIYQNQIFNWLNRWLSGSVVPKYFQKYLEYEN